jgi:hypothetical protein
VQEGDNRKHTREKPRDHQAWAADLQPDEDERGWRN